MKALFRHTFVLSILLALANASFAEDASILKPPPGAKVAVVMFEDLQCPDCARTYPVVWEVANAHKVPVVLHDFPLPIHNWSFKAAVYARFFDTKSQKLGNDYRGFIYQNQGTIPDENALLFYTKKFADENRVPLPFAVDADGSLTAKVRADYDLAQRIGLQHTPTIFVIGQGGNVSTPFVEVLDRDKLTAIIEDMQRQAGSATPVKAPASKKAR
jgi:protein-disulfide isomerase